MFTVNIRLVLFKAHVKLTLLSLHNVSSCIKLQRTPASTSLSSLALDLRISLVDRNVMVKLYHNSVREDGREKKSSLTRSVKNAPIGRLLVKDYRLLLPNTKFQPMMASLLEEDDF